MTTKQRILTRWRELGRPTEAPATEFLAVALTSKTALATARESLRITTRQVGRAWLWDFTNVDDPEPDIVPKPVVVEDTSTRTNATTDWQESMSIGGPTVLDAPSPYSPPQGNVSPTASGHADTFSWVTAGKGDYTVGPDGKKYANHFEEW